MKKLIMACAIVAIAAVTQASTFSWGLGSGSFDATKFATGTAYLFYGSNGGSLSVPDTSTWSTKTGFVYDDLVSSGATLLTSKEISNGLFEGTSSSSNYGTLLASDVGAVTASKMTKFYMAVLSADGKSVALSTVLQKTIANSATVVSAAWSVGNITTYTASAAPEPTSGVLLLLGFAGLALKRKRA